MAFSSPLFIYFFLPIFLALYYSAPRRARNGLILLASLTFYTAGASTIVLVLVGSVWFNHFLAKRLNDDRPYRQSLLVFGIVTNVAALIYYKYFSFFWALIDHAIRKFGLQSLGSAPQVSLPIGISFFTFQALSYLIDVYDGRSHPARSYWEFATYHTLFPQLIAGPIVRYREVSEALVFRSVALPQLTEGAYRFCLGFAKKIVLADNLGVVVDQIVRLPTNQLSFGHAWLGMLCYTLQIYYDFSGYSDMAIGLGKLLGFDFPENFDQPYRATSVTEFWRRWHMTLTRWFRDYVYIPLGGNRCGALRTYLNLAIVFCLCGLWHGAGTNFLVWGIYHGFLLVVERVLDRRWNWRPTGLTGNVTTFILVMVGWVFFRISDMNAAVTYLHAMFMPSSGGTEYFPLSYYLTPDVIFYLGTAIVLAWLPTRRFRQLRWDSLSRLVAQFAFSLASFVCAALDLAANSFNPFIYFRF